MPKSKARMMKYKGVISFWKYKKNYKDFAISEKIKKGGKTKITWCMSV